MILAHVIPLVPPRETQPVRCRMPRVGERAVLLGRVERNQKGPTGEALNGRGEIVEVVRKAKYMNEHIKGESFVEETRACAAACGGHVAEPRLGSLRQRWRRP